MGFNDLFVLVIEVLNIPFVLGVVSGRFFLSRLGCFLMAFSPLPGDFYWSRYIQVVSEIPCLCRVSLSLATVATSITCRGSWLAYLLQFVITGSFLWFVFVSASSLHIFNDGPANLGWVIYNYGRVSIMRLISIPIFLSVQMVVTHI